MSFETVNTNEIIESKEKEPTLEIPAINIIRHGETEYKEIQDPDFKLDLDDPNFTLDANHLDLTEDGIKNIHDNAERLASVIDKDKEAVILITSPQCRAVSSILITEKVLVEHGITVLNSSFAEAEGRSKGIKISPLGLGQLPINEELRKEGFGKNWLKAHKEFGENNPELANMPPAEMHHLVAQSLGKELEEIFSKSHEDMSKGFNRFLRHLINIDKYLQKHTKESLSGKKLRLVMVTHEERLGKFAKDALNLDKTIPKAQMLEIKPEGFLEKDGEIDASICLYGKNDEPDMSSNVKIKFSKGGLIIDNIAGREK